MLSFITLALAAVASVAAHGSLDRVDVGGNTFRGPQPAISGTKLSSAIRQIAEVTPVTDLNSNDMTCGLRAAASADQVIPITAGSDVSVTWKSGLAGPWPHIFGPLNVWMAKCPGSAKNCGGPDLKFFKIAQDGQTRPGANEWAQVAIHDGRPVTFNVPAGIEDGEYLIRHEIIALHNAMSRGGAEVYAGCIQVKITGGGGAKPPANLLTTFPGAYKADDPGILINLYNGPFNYNFPGPGLFRPGSGGSGGAAPAKDPKPPVNVAPNPSSTQSSTPDATASPAPPKSDKPKTDKPKKPLKCSPKLRARALKAKREAKMKKSAIPADTTLNTTSAARRRSLAAHKRAKSRVMPRHIHTEMDHAA